MRNRRTSLTGRRGVARGCAPVTGVCPTRISSCGRPGCPVSWLMTFRLGPISVRWVSVHVASPATVHSSNKVDSASPHRNACDLESAGSGAFERVDSTMILE